MRKINRLMALILSVIMVLSSISVVSAANSYDYIPVDNPDSSHQMGIWSAWYTNLNVPTYIEEGYVEEALLKALEECQLNMNYYNDFGLIGTRHGVPYSLSNKDKLVYSIEKMEIPDTDKTFYNPYKITVNTYFEENGDGTWGFTYSIPVRVVLYVNVIAKTTVEKINTTDSTEDIMVYPWDDFKLTAPYKTNYVVGESLDLTGYKLEVKVADSSLCYFPSCTRTDWDTSYHQLDDAATMQYLSTDNLPLTDNTFNRNGAFSATVRYTHTLDHTAEYENPLLWNGVGYDNVEANFSKSINLAVSQDYVTGIRITAVPEKVNYTEGESFNTSGMSVEAVHRNGTTENITDDVSVSSLPLTLGQTDVYVTYGNLYAVQPITVSKKFVKTVIKAELTKAPDKTVYVAGETINPTGSQVTLTYNDGTTRTVSYGDGTYYILRENEEEGTKITESSAYLGAYVFGCNYETDFTVPITVVEKEITNLAAAAPPEKTIYNDDETFNPDGTRLVATYNDGSIGYFDFTDLHSMTSAGFSGEQLDENHYPVDENMLNNLYTDTKYIRVYANSFPNDVYCDIPITVNEISLTGISVTAPDKTEYTQYDNLDTEGMVVTAQYSDGSTSNVTKYAKVSTTELNTSGTNRIYVVYGGYFGAFDVDVVPDNSLKGIEITTAPDKTSYYSGQMFNTDGMVVTALYNDGTSKVITDYEISNPVLSDGTDKVYINYKGLCEL